MTVNLEAPSRSRKILRRILFILLILIVAVIGFMVFTIHRSFPQTSGNLQVPGLKAQMIVYRDKFGIPQIYASNMHDLFFAQGYVHAQERFWQMDLWRHTGSGRLSEMLGDRLLDTDRFLRTLG